MVGEWEKLLDGVNAHLEPTPYAIYLPSRIDGASELDAGMLSELWATLQKMDIVILPSPSP
jgi:hypothetical protein